MARAPGPLPVPFPMVTLTPNLRCVDLRLRDIPSSIRRGLAAGWSLPESLRPGRAGRAFWFSGVAWSPTPPAAHTPPGHGPRAGEPAAGELLRADVPLGLLGSMWGLGTKWPRTPLLRLEGAERRASWGPETVSRQPHPHPHVQLAVPRPRTPGTGGGTQACVSLRWSAPALRFLGPALGSSNYSFSCTRHLRCPGAARRVLAASATGSSSSMRATVTWEPASHRKKRPALRGRDPGWVGLEATCHGDSGPSLPWPWDATQRSPCERGGSLCDDKAEMPEAFPSG